MNTDPLSNPLNASANKINAAATNAAGFAGFDARLDCALEHKAEPPIPADFAARVALRASAQPLRRRRPAGHFGTLIALLSAAFVTVALFALAPHATPNVRSLSFDIELALIAEIAMIGGWIARMSTNHSALD